MYYKKDLLDIEGNSIDVLIYLGKYYNDKHFIIINSKCIDLTLPEIELFLCLFADSFDDVNECYFKEIERIKEIKKDESFNGRENN